MNVEIYIIASYRREADGTGDSIYVFGFLIFPFLTYLMKIIPGTRRAH
jgi:hypothetical protein